MRAATIQLTDNNLFQCPADDLECLEMWLGATVCRLENSVDRVRPAARQAAPPSHRAAAGAPDSRRPESTRLPGRSPALRD